MPQIDRATATIVSIANLPTFSSNNTYTLERIRKDVRFAIAQRTGELEAVDSPQIDDWINDAYIQILSMMDNPRLTFSSEFTLPDLVTTIAIPGVVDEVLVLNRIVDGMITTIHKSVDIEYWRSLDVNEELDNPLLNYYLHQDNDGLLLQFHKQSLPTRIVIDGTVKPPALTSDTQCPALPAASCLALIDMAISIALRRLGEYTYAGTQNNAALAILRSQLDDKSKSRRGTVAAVTRPRTLEEARRQYGA